MKEIQKFWDKQAANYDYSERRFDPVFRRINAKTKEYLTKNDVILDYGCATGTKTIELAGSVRQIYGIDISPKMIEDAVQKFENAKIKNASFSQGTIFDNDFANTSFDKIIAYGIIHLLEDKEDVIQKIHDLLKPGGLFISSTACLKDKMAIRNRLEFSAYLLIKRLGMFPLYLNMFTTTDVEALVSENGFQIVETEHIFHGITISFIVAKKILEVPVVSTN